MGESPRVRDRSAEIYEVRTFLFVPIFLECDCKYIRILVVIDRCAHYIPLIWKCIICKHMLLFDCVDFVPQYFKTKSTFNSYVGFHYEKYIVASNYDSVSHECLQIFLPFGWRMNYRNNFFPP